MTSFWRELRRRNVFRVGIAYLAVIWVLIQVADIVLPVVNARSWILQALVFSSALGFPLALILAWFYELTPEGIKVTSDVEALEAAKFMGRKVDFAIIGLLVLAVGFLVVENYVFQEQTTVLPNSVAVIPFRNDSPDPDNAYYASGIHEEILNQLVKLSAVSVIARTSVEQYANTVKSIPEIAEELNVETVMEGSVRYDSGRIRITTQLNDGVTGAHLWSETYTRDFDDIFAIESDVAMNVANALVAEFSLAEQENLERIPTESPAAYALYLRALTARRPAKSLFLDQATELDPEFALAYATKAFLFTAQLVGVGSGASPAEASQLERNVRENAERALVLDPTLGSAHAALGVIHQAHWRGKAAENAFQRAIELSPNDVQVLVNFGRFKRYRGEYEEAIALTRRAAELAPNDFYPVIQLALIYRFSGDWGAAAAVWREMGDFWSLGMAEAARSNRDEALAALRIGEQVESASPSRYLPERAHAYTLAGRPDEAMRIFSEFKEAAEEEVFGEALWAYAYIAVGDYEQALRSLDRAVADRVPTDFAFLAGLAANPWADPQLESPEFRALLDALWNDE